MKKQTVNLYTPEGWLDIEAIANLGCWLNVIVGARQVGKTYGILRHLVKNDISAIYLRRTVDELDLVSSSADLNPFMALSKEDYQIDILKEGKNLYIWGDAVTEDNKRRIEHKRGLGLSLGTIAKMRGFAGYAFTDVFFDEFIPEKTVIKRKSEGDALLNAYVTINGNRELEGKPPLKLWLAANAFDISSDILSVLGLTDEFDKLTRRGEEYAILEGGVFLAFPRSEQVIDRRSQTAMMSYLKRKESGGAFRNMALNNSFSYDALNLVKPKPIKGYKPLACIDGMYLWHNNTSIYVCESAHGSRMVFDSTPESKWACETGHPEFRTMYNAGYITFQSTQLLLKFREYFGIKA